MPNHVHAIIEIDSFKIKNAIQIPSEEKKIKIKSLSSLMGAFKTTASKKIHELGYLKFSWQRSFHDHIIRDEKAYINICNYITSNPDKWQIGSFQTITLEQF
jgi:REP element-mobilizing transposase RayT